MNKLKNGLKNNKMKLKNNQNKDLKMLLVKIKRLRNYLNLKMLIPGKRFP